MKKAPKKNDCISYYEKEVSGQCSQFGIAYCEKNGEPCPYRRTPETMRAARKRNHSALLGPQFVI